MPTRLISICLALTVFGATVSLTARAAFAEESALQNELAELRERVDRLEQETLVELRAIRALLEARQDPHRGHAHAQPKPQATVRPKAQRPERRAKVGVTASPTLGDADAPVTIVEFTDYQCPFCAKFYRNIFPTLKEQYIDTGKVRFVSRELPLKMHKQAFKASVAAHCAANQGQFWEMRDILFMNQKALLATELDAYALTLDLDYDLFSACFTNDAPADLIQHDLDDAAAAGITGTPTFVIGKTVPGKTIIEGTVLSGAQPVATFAAAIDKLLEAGDTATSAGE